MRFSVPAAIFCALCSTVTATPGPGTTHANLQARQPISKDGKSSAKGKLNRAAPCAQEGEYCRVAADCCGALLCGENGCFKLKSMNPRGLMD
ncbi:uncharacterized protein PgNI_12117 [Pyricularia grisea]|uniref:Uncharacterized protein n=1 Tax=Pyricularia grisea TaxID=148305 RepID=A0A6P8AQR5_PYRGI|nr:uncharacterized protein PgNI_12117 [Pyricularia grisea]TLD04402.1 hypothetical protein PgNI_12117 [Pyricularia grisea]